MKPYLTGCALSAVAALALAEPPAAEQSPEEAAPRDVLRGPSVDGREVPGVRDEFAPGMSDPRMAMAQRIPPRVYHEVLREMSGPRTPAALRLTPAQRRDLREMGLAHRQRVQEFRDGALSGRDPRELEPRERRRLMRDAPKPDEHYARIWSVLSEAQREHAGALLDSAMERARAGRMQGDGPDRPARPEPAMTLDATDAERIERIGERIMALPPRARDRLLMRMERLVDRAERASEGPEDKPAPSVDDVEISRSPDS